MNHSDDTFRIIWRFDGAYNTRYCVVQSLTDETYKMFRETDLDEPSYTNIVVKKDYLSLNGTFIYDDYYVTVQNNVIHCETGPAVRCPGGIDNFRLHEYIENYLIHGKVMSQYSWLTWVKGTASWPMAMAHFLGSKNNY